MKIRIEIDADNAAFDGNEFGFEVARILKGMEFSFADIYSRDYAARILHGKKYYDSNGNTAATVKIAGK